MRQPRQIAVMPGRVDDDKVMGLRQRIDRVGLTGSIPKRGIKVKLEKLDRNFVKEPVKGNIHRLVDLTL